MMMMMMKMKLIKLMMPLSLRLLRSDQKKTKVKKKTSNPQFEETFFFEVNPAALHTVVTILLTLIIIFIITVWVGEADPFPPSSGHTLQQLLQEVPLPGGGGGH